MRRPRSISTAPVRRSSKTGGLTTEAGPPFSFKLILPDMELAFALVRNGCLNGTAAPPELWSLSFLKNRWFRLRTLENRKGCGTHIWISTTKTLQNVQSQ